MKTSLQLKMGQQLTMTPQLQQAIRLLQLSTLDLQQEIQEALESNPLLEVEENSEPEPSKDNDLRDDSRDISDSHTSDSVSSSDEHHAEQTELSDQYNKEEMPNELPVDSDWDDTFQPSASVGSTSSSSAGSSDDFDYDARQSTTESLQDHLLWQLNLTPMTDVDTEIAYMLIDGVDDDGYLSTTVEDVVESLGERLDIEKEEVLAVLHRLQQFDPAGCFACDLSECLLLQLHQFPDDTPLLAEARMILKEHMALLGTRDFTTLMRRTRLKEDQLKGVLSLIKSLNPKPGAGVESEQSEYVIPDVLVRKVKDNWSVELNPEIAPKLHVNQSYAALIKRADNSPDNTFLKDNLQEARWFIKSLQSRNETLLKVASKIVEFQLDFFERGAEYMKPLVLHDIAEAVGMHESTISRVTTQKFMHTTRGLFELKYFFSSHVSTDSGGECSSTAIRAMIKKLIGEENTAKPLSDNKIATMLGEKGIKVARRTVAKYREAMMIPPSNERKELV